MGPDVLSFRKEVLRCLDEDASIRAQASPDVARCRQTVASLRLRAQRALAVRQWAVSWAYNVSETSPAAEELEGKLQSWAPIGRLPRRGPFQFEQTPASSLCAHSPLGR